jgi:hypothetical protein
MREEQARAPVLVSSTTLTAAGDPAPSAPRPPPPGYRRGDPQLVHPGLHFEQLGRPDRHQRDPSSRPHSSRSTRRPGTARPPSSAASVGSWKSSSQSWLGWGKKVRKSYRGRTTRPRRRCDQAVGVRHVRDPVLNTFAMWVPRLQYHSGERARRNVSILRQQRSKDGDRARAASIENSAVNAG